MAFCGFIALQMPAKRRRRDSSRDVTPVDYADEHPEGSAEHADACGSEKQQLPGSRAGESMAAEGLPAGVPAQVQKLTPEKAALTPQQQLANTGALGVSGSGEAVDVSRRSASQQQAGVQGKENSSGVAGFAAGQKLLPSMHAPLSAAAAVPAVAYLTPVDGAAGYAVMLADAASRAVIWEGAGDAGGPVLPPAVAAAAPAALGGSQLARGNICVRGPAAVSLQQQQVQQWQKRQWEPGHDTAIVWQVRAPCPLEKRNLSISGARLMHFLNLFWSVRVSPCHRECSCMPS